MIDPKDLTRNDLVTLEALDCVDINFDVVRGYFDNYNELPETFETALDNAQGHVSSGAGDVAYVLIKVTR